MQIWPASRNLEPTDLRATSAMSASSNTSTGAWPPSSRVARLMPSAARWAICRPTAVDPVKVTLRICGDRIRCSEMAAVCPKTTLSTPGGSPASTSALASASPVAGVSSAGLITTVQPAASAAPTLRAGMVMGKFHGVNAATGPIGCLSTMSRVPGVREGTMRPYTRRPSSANQSRMSAAATASTVASPTGFPARWW
jgi:hypothetical protein